MFIPAHKNFRVIAIAAPVPPYPGYPLDPPVRSRFQARFIDPVGSLLSLTTSKAKNITLYEKLRDLILSTQYASESRSALEVISKTALPPFPQTALVKLQRLVEKFPPPEHLSPAQLARLFLTIHPALIFAPFQAWAILSRQTDESGLGALGSPSMASVHEDVGMFGYRLLAIQRLDDSNVQLTFTPPPGLQLVIVAAPAGPKELRPFPLVGKLEFNPTPRFMGLLTSFLQAHALGWDISLIPPALPSTASSSTSTLVKVFGEILGYNAEVIHMYKELGGRELVMRRKIEDGGATTWEPRLVVHSLIFSLYVHLHALQSSTLVEGAWSGRLLHLAGLDVIGSTAGSISRILQDREIELWENKRIVAEASPEEVCDKMSASAVNLILLFVPQIASGELSVAHPSFRVISTASKSLLLKDWLSDEHANMFFSVPSQPMDTAEESTVLLATGCPQALVDSLLIFAEKYRQSMSTENVLKNRKLGTRSLVRIARRLASYPQDTDLRSIIQRSLLAEFLPATEKMNLNTLLEDSNIFRKTAPVRL